MPVAASNIVYRLSGGASNTAAASSIGGAKSSTVAPVGLFADVTDVQCRDGVVKYRTIYVHNSHASDTLSNPVAWLSANTPSASTTVEVALGAAGVNGTEPLLANDTTAPSGVVFSASATKGAGLALGSIPAGQHRAVHFRYTVSAGTAALASDTYKLMVEGETTA